ncbi:MULTISPECIES: type II toxin-antitoxin system ParD family antitoxin [Paraburkholderia]|uniref:Type II toxin-antitoxin system ParD family antitoxin n=1 Tax=Paraburkholderia strydomiana TaxID=1245417 RepID=A0ABW9C379_9BURK|nr:type II toxin-antitoxin system ParD family antitoxin [Paraburkholderia strydomiana]MDR7005494.1 putative addiction module CopG family antidote [Paraburkholderia strydomiana]
MLSKHASNVSLAEHLASFVRKEINKGRYGTVSEVVGVGLCLLNEDVARRAVSGSGKGAVRTTHSERTHGRSEA